MERDSQNIPDDDFDIDSDITINMRENINL
jgi:hypothetical protein